MFDNTGLDNQFLANVGRIADALERIAKAMEKRKKAPPNPTVINGGRNTEFNGDAEAAAEEHQEYMGS
jgi:hypothetical protein